ncbi:hypothetical protein BH23BAC1_BH23BAC1_05640 [soil metagenome]
MGHVGNNSYGTLDSAPKGKIIDTVINYVTSVLQDFEGKADDNENHLTNNLCKLLGFKKPPEFPFYFQHQNIESSRENTSTDFAAFGTYSFAQLTNQEGEEFPLIKFESKRLSASLPSSREKEYVIGEYENDSQTKNSGGIERFKNLRHGKDVNHSGLIGYIQTGTFKHWEEKVNSWIAEEIKNPHDATLVWDNNDYLKTNLANDKINSYLSNPKRKIITELKMHHIWVQLNF